MRTISLKLTSLEFALVSELAGRGNFKNISDVLRQALLLLAQRWKIHPHVLAAVQLERNAHEPRFRKQTRLPFGDQPEEQEQPTVSPPAGNTKAPKRR